MKMKILLGILMVFLMSLSVSALVQYTGAPTVPYLVYGKVSWNDQLLSGARLEISNGNTGYTKQITTDSKGVWQQDAMNWLTSVSYRIPVQGGDTITVRILDGCGTGDTCEKSIVAMSPGNEYSAQIDFSINGDLSCPPINCPSCSCGSGGSYTCPTTTCTEEECAETICPTTDCLDTPTCPEEKVCDECPEPEDKDGFNYFLAVLFAVAGAGIGSYGTYKLKQGEAVTYKKGTGYKVYVGRDGTLKEVHKHPGTTGYHSLKTQHNPVQERHPAGIKTAYYEKDASGAWKYVG